MHSLNIDSNIIRNTLGSICDIPDIEWNNFEVLLTNKSLKKGEFLLEQGAVTNHFYFIIQGMVRFFYITKDGKEFNKAFHSENEFIGSLLTLKRAAPSTFSIQAIEDCKLIAINYNEFSKLFGTHICWERIGRVMAEELAIKKELREKEFLLDSAEVRYRTFIADYPSALSRIKLGQIASYLGITQVQLSRIRKKISN